MRNKGAVNLPLSRFSSTLRVEGDGDENALTMYWHCMSVRMKKREKYVVLNYDRKYCFHIVHFTFLSEGSKKFLPRI